MSLKLIGWLCVCGLAISSVPAWAQEATNAPQALTRPPSAFTKSPSVEPRSDGERVYRSKKLRIHKHPQGRKHGKHPHQSRKRSERWGAQTTVE